MKQQQNPNAYGQYVQSPYNVQPNYNVTNQQVPYYSAQQSGMGVPVSPQQQAVPNVPQVMPQQTISAQVPGMLPIEQSYIENILRLNKGKLVSVHATFENNREWNAKIFNGLIEAAGRDHIIISDPQTGERYLIPMVFVDYVTFEEEIEYEPIFGAASLTTHQPR